MFVKFLLRPVFVGCFAALFSLAAGSAALAGPSDEELGDLAEALQTRVTTEFMDTPVFRVGEYIERESGLVVAIDSFADAVPINLKFEDATVRQVLDRIALTTELDWVIEDGVIFIANDADVIRKRVVRETYNLRGLMVLVPDFNNSPAMDLDESLSNTNSGGSNGGGGGGGDGGGSALFGSDGSDIRNTQTAGEFIEDIAELIQDTTGSPDLWLDDVFSIREVQSMLVIRATPEVHEQVELLLAQLDKSLSLMLAVEVQYLVVPRDDIDALEGDFIMNKEQCDAFVAGLDNGNVRRLGSMRTVCHNGQQIYTLAGINQGFISDVEPIPDTTSIDPTISVARTGTTTDIVPTVTYSGKHIELAIRSDMVHAASIETTPIPVASNAEMGAEVEHAAIGEVQLGLVTQHLTRFRTNARVPNGGGVILTVSTNVFEDIDPDRFEVILLVRTHVLEEDAD